MEDKEKFRRNTRVFQGILTQSSAKFAEKTRAKSYENKFLYQYFTWNKAKNPLENFCNVISHIGKLIFGINLKSRYKIFLRKEKGRSKNEPYIMQRKL